MRDFISFFGHGIPFYMFSSFPQALIDCLSFQSASGHSSNKLTLEDYIDYKNRQTSNAGTGHSQPEVPNIARLEKHEADGQRA